MKENLVWKIGVKRLMRIQSCLIVPMLGVKPIFIQDTLRNNLTLWNEAVTDTHIKEVLERVNLLSFLGRIDEQVSDSFSEGQTKNRPDKSVFKRICCDF